MNGTTESGQRPMDSVVILTKKVVVDTPFPLTCLLAATVSEK